MIDSKTAEVLRNLAQKTSGEEFKMTVLNMLEGSTTEKNSVPKEKKDNAKNICAIFRELGIPAHIKGYNYLMEAIIFCLDRGGTKCSITMELYPTIAQKFDTKSSCVERAIRHAIESGYDRRGTYEGYEKYFGDACNPSRGKPTNSKFIYGIVTWIQHNT